MPINRRSGAFDQALALLHGLAVGVDVHGRGGVEGRVALVLPARQMFEVPKP